MPGPIPMRSEDRLGHADPARAVEKIRMSGDVEVPPPHPAWHPLAKNFYLSLNLSGQSVYFEPSDWHYAQIAAELLDTIVRMEDTNASLVAQFNEMTKRLLVTEADRRKSRMEVERVRAVEKTEKSTVTNINDRRARLAKGDR